MSYALPKTESMMLHLCNIISSCRLSIRPTSTTGKPTGVDGFASMQAPLFTDAKGDTIKDNLHDMSVFGTVKKTIDASMLGAEYITIVPHVGPWLGSTSKPSKPCMC